MVIGGEERTLKFGINQTDLFCELRGWSLSKYQDFLVRLGTNEFSVSEYRDLVWSALKDGARYDGREFEFDALTVGDWLDEVPEYAEFVMNEFLKSMPKANGGQPAKKKQKVSGS